MKCKIPAANKVFTNNKANKEIDEKIVIDWLNSEVYEAIMSTRPKLSPTNPIKTTGFVEINIPHSYYYNNQNEFISITKEQLVPLGYSIEFIFDESVGFARCFIRWEHLL